MSNHIYRLFLGDFQPGRYDEKISHYNVLRTLVDVLDIKPVGREDAERQSVGKIWK
jgi:hypothetical protein